MKFELTKYQQKWLADQSRFKLGVWCRQSGKSFVTSLDAVLDVVKNRSQWVFLSAGERQTKENIAKCRMHLEALSAIATTTESTILEDSTTGIVYNQLEIKLPNGGRIIGLPANPFTARGHSANLVLDEFAFHQNSSEIWRAIFPTITRGYKLSIVSTPNGRLNRFYDLWANSNHFSKYFNDIHKAVAEGLVIYDEEGKPTTPDFIRTMLDDEDSWQQEYLCLFLDEAVSFIGLDVIALCESDLSLENGEFCYDYPLIMGVDVGRTQDSTVIWTFQYRQLEDLLVHHNITRLSRVPFREQQEIIQEQIQAYQPYSVSIDSSGLGMHLSENLQDSFGSLIKPVRFNRASKERMAVLTKARFQNQKIIIPKDRFIRTDIHKVKRIISSAGNVRFDAEHTRDGHSDRFWAMAMCIEAVEDMNREFGDVKTLKVRDIEISFLNKYNIREHTGHSMQNVMSGY